MLSLPGRALRHLPVLALAVVLTIVPSLPGTGPVGGSLDLVDRGAEAATAMPPPPVAAEVHASRIATTAPAIEQADAIELLSGASDPAAGPKRVHRIGRRSTAAGDPSQVEPDATAPAAAAGPRWGGGFNLYRKTAFVTQRDFKWCVAASVQMMVNIVRHRSDRTIATQERMIAYAQASDHGPWGPGGGTDVSGWIAALRHFGAGRYRAVGTQSPGAALRIAATAMRQTGRPAGMLVMDGRHAWILHGFESRTDPRRDRRATITSVRVSGPLYPVQQKNGYDLRPNTELSIRALARYFQPSSVGALVGKYVVIVPVH